MTSTNKTKTINTETHPLLPSGEWEGFYCYKRDSEQHKMSIELLFENGNVSGTGVDDVAPFTWKGKYHLETFKIEMVKSYSTHSVLYKGDIDENGIWGMWKIAHDFSRYPEAMKDIIKAAFKNDLNGGFHIWPKKIKSNINTNEKEEEIESSKILEELFLEVFG